MTDSSPPSGPPPVPNSACAPHAALPGKLLADLPAPGAEEAFATLFSAPGCRIERIVSHGHASPPGFWYDQDEDEWVMLVQGAATLAFYDGRRLMLSAGDWVTIPAHCRHRVESTAPTTVWLAVFARRS